MSELEEGRKEGRIVQIYMVVKAQSDYIVIINYTSEMYYMMMTLGQMMMALMMMILVRADDDTR